MGGFIGIFGIAPSGLVNPYVAEIIFYKSHPLLGGAVD